MIKEFCNYFNIEELEFNSFNEFIIKYGGKSYGNKLFSIFSLDEITTWQKNVENFFPEYINKFVIFSYDWLGNCFGINKHNNNILLFEIGTHEVLKIPVNFEQFLNNEIVQNSDACLVSSFFNEWKNKKKKDIPEHSCVGYRIPLFMGGEDNVNNLEIIDMDVYWTITSQFYEKVLNKK